jgi:two-component system cell cycle sensor histidine kinase/response regulator CckA
VLATILRRNGMTPLTAASGDEALRIYAEQQDRVNLILLDLTMPGLSGEETLRLLRARNRDQRVILMSGFSERDSMALCAELGVNEFIAKPFELSALLKKLQAALR